MTEETSHVFTVELFCFLICFNKMVDAQYLSLLKTDFIILEFP